MILVCDYLYIVCVVFFFKQKTAYEMRISDWSSDVCSSDLLHAPVPVPEQIRDSMLFEKHVFQACKTMIRMRHPVLAPLMIKMGAAKVPASWYRMPIYYKSNRFSVNGHDGVVQWPRRSEEHTSELQSLMRRSYAVFCLKKQNYINSIQ